MAVPIVGKGGALPSIAP